MPRTGALQELPGYPVVAVNGAIDTTIDLGNVDKDSALFFLMVYATNAGNLVQVAQAANVTLSDADTGVLLDAPAFNMSGTSELIYLFSRAGCFRLTQGITPENNSPVSVITGGFQTKRVRVQVQAFGAGVQGNVEAFGELLS